MDGLSTRSFTGENYSVTQIQFILQLSVQSVVHTWCTYQCVQLEHPQGDRHLISYSPILQVSSGKSGYSTCIPFFALFPKKLVELEISTGVQFRHIRLLAKAFTHSSMQYSSLVGYVNVYV